MKKELKARETRIREALKILEDEGRKYYKPEYQAGIPVWRAIGKAIACETDSARNILDMAYTALKDWNYHDLCFVINWVFALYDGPEHAQDLQRLTHCINKKNVTVLDGWNSEKEDYNKKRVSVNVVIAPEEE